MKEVKINSTKINEVNKEVVFEPQLICIDSTDVRFALMGKSGVMYQEAKSAGEMFFVLTFILWSMFQNSITDCLLSLLMR